MRTTYIEARQRYRELSRKKAQLQQQLAELEADMAEALIEMQRLAEHSYINAEAETLTLREVARLLNVSYDTVYRMVRSGELTTVRFGRTYRVPRQAIRELQNQKAGAVTPAG